MQLCWRQSLKINFSSVLGSPVSVADLNSVLNSERFRALKSFSWALIFMQVTLLHQVPLPSWHCSHICTRLLDFTFTLCPVHQFPLCYHILSMNLERRFEWWGPQGWEILLRCWGERGGGEHQSSSAVAGKHGRAVGKYRLQSATCSDPGLRRWNREEGGWCGPTTHMGWLGTCWLCELSEAVWGQSALWVLEERLISTLLFVLSPTSICTK